jgi:hypothetical protein
VSDRPEEQNPPAASADAESSARVPEGGGVTSGRETIASVSVRRAPRYYRFMLVGLILGIVITLILTFGFPEQDDFNRLQVFGFVGIFVVALCVGLGALIAILLDRSSRKRARTVSAERIEEHDTIPVADFVQVVDSGAPRDEMAPEAAAPEAAAPEATRPEATATEATAREETPRDDEKA